MFVFFSYSVSCTETEMNQWKRCATEKDVKEGIKLFFCPSSIFFFFPEFILVFHNKTRLRWIRWSKEPAPRKLSCYVLCAFSAEAVCLSTGQDVPSLYMQIRTWEFGPLPIAKHNRGKKKNHNVKCIVALDAQRIWNLDPRFVNYWPFALKVFMLSFVYILLFPLVKRFK